MEICIVCHTKNLQVNKTNYWCRNCGITFLPSRRNFTYDDNYPLERNHDNGSIVTLKKQTFEKWIEILNLNIVNKKTMEFGFGNGAILELLKKSNNDVYGVEVVERNRKQIIKSGIEKEKIVSEIFNFSAEFKFDFVFYFDSFEHICEPESHLKYLQRNLKVGSQAIVVLPNGDSLSRKIFGRFWPHDLPDHWIFYSRKGFELLWSRSGWKVVKKFSPIKVINLTILLQHFLLKLGFRIPFSLPQFLDFKINFNIGEMGYLMEFDPGQSCSVHKVENF